MVRLSSQRKLTTSRLPREAAASNGVVPSFNVRLVSKRPWASRLRSTVPPAARPTAWKISFAALAWAIKHAMKKGVAPSLRGEFSAPRPSRIFSTGMWPPTAAANMGEVPSDGLSELIVSQSSSSSMDGEELGSSMDSRRSTKFTFPDLHAFQNVSLTNGAENGIVVVDRRRVRRSGRSCSEKERSS